MSKCDPMDARIATLTAALQEAQARLAMLWEMLYGAHWSIKSDSPLLLEAEQVLESRRLDHTAFLARVKREGAAAELRAMQRAHERMVKDEDGELLYAVPSSVIYARAAELDRER